MRVTLIRHFKVDYAWKGRYTPEGFRIAQREYDEAGVLDQNVKLANHFHTIIVSNLRRTSLTLEYALGAREHLTTELLNEVPMDPFTTRDKEYPLATFATMARIRWLFNFGEQTETRIGSLRRANTFIKEYLSEDGDYLIIGHGFFLRLLCREMVKKGFSGKPFDCLKNGESFAYELATP